MNRAKRNIALLTDFPLRPITHLGACLQANKVQLELNKLKKFSRTVKHSFCFRVIVSAETFLFLYTLKNNLNALTNM